MPPKKIPIIYDDREKKPWDAKYFGEGFTLASKRLKTGDYTIKGMEGILAVEKKSGWPEIASNLSTKANRERLEACMSRLSEFPLRYLVIEDEVSLIKHCKLRARNASHQGLIKWVLDESLRYGVPVIFIGNCVYSKYIVRTLFSSIYTQHKAGVIYYHDC